MIPPIMTKDTCRLGASMLLAAFLLAACKSEAKKGPDSTALGADSSLNRDLAMANRDSTSAPQLKDVPANSPAATPPAATPPAATPPAATPPAADKVPAESEPKRKEPPKKAHDVTPSIPKPGAPATTPSNSTAAASPAKIEPEKTGTIAAGTTLNLHATDRVCTNVNAVGDHVTGTLDGAVPGTNGASIPSGATVNLTVTQLKRAENTGDSVVIRFTVNSVTYGGRTYPLDGTVTSASIDRIRDEPTSKDAEKVAVGAVAGAIAGKLIGKTTKGAVVGGVVGAGAGAAAAAATGNYQGCIPSGGAIVVKLNSAATVKL
jgi:hypothetical protein